MRHNLSHLNRKLILGGILLILGGVLLPLTTNATDYHENKLTENHFFSFDENGNVFTTFSVKETFSIAWQQQNYVEGNRCTPKIISGFHKYTIWKVDGTYFYTLKPENFGLFSDGDCYKTETYIAGKTYKMYLIKKELGSIVPGWTAEQVEENCLQNYEYFGKEGIFEIWTDYLEDGNRDKDNGDSTYKLTYIPTIDIIAPLDEAELIQSFTMEIDYFDMTGYDRLMIIFEDWDASSTCPEYGSEDWHIEYGPYFNNQSMPYFSDFLATTTASTTIFVDDCDTGDYNCIRCYAINESTGAISSELCKDYNLKVVVYIPPEEQPIYYLPISDWNEFYSEHSERFATPTALFTNWAGAFEPLISQIGTIILFFQDYFNPDVAKAKGQDMGNAVATARGYVENIDDFFGGLPLSTIFIFYIITAILVILYRIIRGFLTIIIP